MANRKGEKTVSYFVLLGRILYSSIFIMANLFHFSGQSIAHAAAEGVPMPGVLVPVSGIIGLAGGFSILLGYKVKWGAWLLVLFLVPVTLMMHKFWAVAEPQVAIIHQVMFMKNVSMLGAALLLAHFGAGPLSLDALITRVRAQALKTGTNEENNKEGNEEEPKNRYIPGVCNIGPAEIKKRKRAGWMGLVTTVGLWGTLTYLDAPKAWRLLLFLPAMISAVGFLQAYMHFCAYYGFAALLNFGDAGKTDAVIRPEFRSADRLKAGRIVVYSTLIGIAVAILAYVI